MRIGERKKMLKKISFENELKRREEKEFVVLCFLQRSCS